MNHAKIVSARELVDDRARPIRRVVIDDDELQRDAVVGASRKERLGELAESAHARYTSAPPRSGPGRGPSGVRATRYYNSRLRSLCYDRPSSQLDLAPLSRRTPRGRRLPDRARLRPRCAVSSRRPIRPGARPSASSGTTRARGSTTRATRRSSARGVWTSGTRCSSRRSSRRSSTRRSRRSASACARRAWSARSPACSR